jgi:hypothetical protein
MSLIARNVEQLRSVRRNPTRGPVQPHTHVKGHQIDLHGNQRHDIVLTRPMSMTQIVTRQKATWTSTASPRARLTATWSRGERSPFPTCSVDPRNLQDVSCTERFGLA